MYITCRRALDGSPWSGTPSPHNRCHLRVPAREAELILVASATGRTSARPKGAAILTQHRSRLGGVCVDM